LRSAARGGRLLRRGTGTGTGIMRRNGVAFAENEELWLVEIGLGGHGLGKGEKVFLEVLNALLRGTFFLRNWDQRV